VFSQYFEQSNKLKNEVVVLEGDSGLFLFDTVLMNIRNCNFLRQALHLEKGSRKRETIRRQEMFDVRSDFALNKAKEDTIVCKSVTGVHTELKQENFSSAEEFLWWKKWSDDDYLKIEADGRDDTDCCTLNPECDSTGLSVEDELIIALDTAATDITQRKITQDGIAAIKTVLTEIQYRRLWMYHVDDLSMTEIAARENVSLPRISNCLAEAHRRIVNKS